MKLSLLLHSIGQLCYLPLQVQADFLHAKFERAELLLLRLDDLSLLEALESLDDALGGERPPGRLARGGKLSVGWLRGRLLRGSTTLAAREEEVLFGEILDLPSHLGLLSLESGVPV